MNEREDAAGSQNIMSGQAKYVLQVNHADVINFASAGSGGVDPVEHALRGVLEMHHEIASPSPGDDPWQLPSFDKAVLEDMLGVFIKGWLASAEPAELLLLHAIPLYLDAVLRIEADKHLLALTGVGDSRVLRADLHRAHAASPTIASRLARAERADDTATVEALRRWLAHQATLLSPSIWEQPTARQLAQRTAGLIEERGGGPVEELADFIRRVGRHAAYTVSSFDHHVQNLRVPACPEPLKMRPSLVAWLVRFAWQAALDPRRIGLRIAEHLGMQTPFDLVKAVNDLRSAHWMVDHGRIELHAWCSHPAVAHALIEHVHHVEHEIGVIRNTSQLDIFDQLHASERGVRPRTKDGEAAFQLPIVSLGMSQDAIRQLLMGTALYGRPQLAVRELYQNAMDACRRRAMRRTYLRMSDHPKLTEYQGKVVVRQQRLADGRVMVECVDNGVGMSVTEVRESFTQAGKRFTDLVAFQDEQARWTSTDPGLRLYPNSRFGIGVFSYFMLSDEIQMDTVAENPDGTIGPALRVLVSAPSGLVTISPLASVPNEIAHGGTIIRLFLGPASHDSEDEADTVDTSVLALLEELVATTEVELTVVEDGHEPRTWQPQELSLAVEGRAMLAFERDGCRGWWVTAGGGVLADGIKTDIELEGLLVDLRGPHAPMLRADRNQVVDWDLAWTLDQFTAAADTVSDWEDVTLEWLWRVSLIWPALGVHLLHALQNHRPFVRVGSHSFNYGQIPDAHVDIRITGCLPDDLRSIGRGPYLDGFSPFVAYPRSIADSSTSGDRPDAHWPSTLVPWRLAVWRAAAQDSAIATHLASEISTWRHLSAIESCQGHPVIDPVDAALLCSAEPEYGSPPVVMAEPLALAAGAARSGIDLAAAIRRLRRFHVCGVALPDVDARDFEGAVFDSEVVDMLMSTIAVQRSERHSLTGAAIVTAHELNRPLRRIADAFDMLERLGMRDVPQIAPALMGHVPLSSEVQLMGTADISTQNIARTIKEANPRQARELRRLLDRYSDLLEHCGVDLALVRRICDDDFTAQERVAWSFNVRADDMWMFGAHIEPTHFVRVAAERGIDLREAQQLVLRCPAIDIDERYREPLPTIMVDAQLGELVGQLHWRLSRRRFRKPANSGYRRMNALEFAELARSVGLPPGEAAQLLRALPFLADTMPDVDWAVEEPLQLTALGRLLLQERDEDDPSSRGLTLFASTVGPAKLVRKAAELGESLTVIATAAHSLESLGVRCDFPDPVPDRRPTAIDGALADEISEAGILGLPELLASLDRVAGWEAAPHSELIAKLAEWAAWMWPDTPETCRVLEALGRFHPHSDDRLALIAGRAVPWLQQLARGGGVSRAHLIEMAGVLGVSIDRLRDAMRPFDEILDVSGYEVPWFPDPIGSPQDWLDVSLVALLVARPDSETTAFLNGNLPADPEVISERRERWEPILASDPGADAIRRSGDTKPVSGMVRWR